MNEDRRLPATTATECAVRKQIALGTDQSRDSNKNPCALGVALAHPQSLSHKGWFPRVVGTRTGKYPSDGTDEQWQLVEELIPVYPGGRSRAGRTGSPGGWP